MQNAKGKGKMPDFTAIVTPIFNYYYGYGELTSARACYHA